MNDKFSRKKKIKKKIGFRQKKTYPAHADDKQWVNELSFKFVFRKMPILTES